MKSLQIKIGLSVVLFLMVVTSAAVGEDWLQFKYDSRHSGNVPERSVSTPLGLVGAVALSDAIFTSPVVAGGRIYIVDGSGTAFCIDAENLSVIWKRQTAGGKVNCNNVSSPALIDGYLHFGTMAGNYYVLKAVSGRMVKKIACGEPIFSAPVAANGRVYFATLGSQVYAVEPDGKICWKWDFVKEQLRFNGNRWSGKDWLEHKGERVTWEDQFCCTRNLAVYGNMVVVPAGGRIVWLEDVGDGGEFRQADLGQELLRTAKRESPVTLGLSIDEDGTVYRQWHRRDNRGQVETVRLVDGELTKDAVGGTKTWNNLPWLMSFTSVSMRGKEVYRCRPEEDFGFCKHSPGQEQAQYLGGFPSIAPPVLLRNNGVYGGLDGSLYVVPLSGSGKVWSFKTAFGKAISAPAAVCDGRIYFGCEDGYLYVLGPGGKSPLPSKDLQLWRIRNQLTSKLAGAKYNRTTSFADPANTNNNPQGIRPPFKINWIRRYKGTAKHFSTCGGGRMYTHTAEGQIFAVEQETGRLLWRRYWPGAHISFTTPLYHKDYLLLPQAGIKKSRLRKLDAATGELVWEAPFTGSPSWNRQLPPIVYKNLVIYLFSTGKYTGESWLFEHQSTFGFSKDQKPLLRAWDINTGKEVWTADFSEYGYGGDDAGMCLMDGRLYYSCYFGGSAKREKAGEGSSGITAAINPASGKVIWLTTKYAVHAGCTVSGKDGRLYMGGYNRVDGDKNRVWCLDAEDGSLIWQSEPVKGAIHVITIGEKHLFTHAQYRTGYLLDKETGKIADTLAKGYHCTRFNMSGPYLLSANMEVRDLSDGVKLISSGPQVDVLQCIAAFVSNGRIFYTANGGGLQVSMMCGEEAEALVAAWETN
ncbi:MAG: outer membrane protein assembly factor BamB family protein [Planctomycetota bacterium]|jgi:outer membrane protein assembly factor BamB